MSELQACIDDLKESMACNKKRLSQSTWEEILKIILKPEAKKTEHFEVPQRPEGKPMKASLDTSAAARQQTGERLKQRTVEEKRKSTKDNTDLPTCSHWC